uniref:Uncharacterized protein n=1 Tax=Cacopsylla melanoneura TaxID=428564 RepID=A0A8D8VMC4_9HEMI
MLFWMDFLEILHSDFSKKSPAALSKQLDTILDGFSRHFTLRFFKKSLSKQLDAVLDGFSRHLNPLIFQKSSLRAALSKHLLIIFWTDNYFIDICSILSISLYISTFYLK